MRKGGNVEVCFCNNSSLDGNSCCSTTHLTQIKSESSDKEIKLNREGKRKWREWGTLRRLTLAEEIDWRAHSGDRTLKKSLRKRQTNEICLF